MNEKILKQYLKNYENNKMLASDYCEIYYNFIIDLDVSVKNLEILSLFYKLEVTFLENDDDFNVNRIKNELLCKINFIKYVTELEKKIGKDFTFKNDDNLENKVITIFNSFENCYSVDEDSYINLLHLYYTILQLEYFSPSLQECNNKLNQIRMRIVISSKNENPVRDLESKINEQLKKLESQKEY